MLAVVAFFTLRTLFEINDFDDEALTVKVTGQQWWWEYEYDVDGDGEFTEEVLTANDLVIPAGVDVEPRHRVATTSSTRSGSPRSTARRTPCPAAPTS